jgi:citrate lyase subunit beta/citryl-CoA lyase
MTSPSAPVGVRPPRSLLFLPASNPRAVAKARTLPCDAVILDLEDAVAPEEKAQARAAAAEAVAARGFGDRLLVVRINGLSTPWGAEDLEVIGRASPDAVLAPKVEGSPDIALYDERLSGGTARLWAMIETAGSHLSLPAIAGAARTSRLEAMVIGPNDYAKEMRARMTPERAPFFALFSLAVAAARSEGLEVFDGPFGAIEDLAGLERECAQARDFGFDGKTLIHPSHIETCNRAFSPSAQEIAEARAIVAAFADPAAADRGAVRVMGRMAERLHLAAAERLLERALRLADLSPPGP